VVRSHGDVGAGSLSPCVDPAGYLTDAEFKFVPDQWNHYEVTADGDHLVVTLNGTKTLDVHDSRFSEGRIRLQYQKYPIEFKNIKLLAIKHR
jgi:hypothetical protein